MKKNDENTKIIENGAHQTNLVIEKNSEENQILNEQNIETNDNVKDENPPLSEKNEKMELINKISNFAQKAEIDKKLIEISTRDKKTKEDPSKIEQKEEKLLITTTGNSELFDKITDFLKNAEIDKKIEEFVTKENKEENESNTVIVIQNENKHQETRKERDLKSVIPQEKPINRRAEFEKRAKENMQNSSELAKLKEKLNLNKKTSLNESNNQKIVQNENNNNEIVKIDEKMYQSEQIHKNATQSQYNNKNVQKVKLREIQSVTLKKPLESINEETEFKGIPHPIFTHYIQTSCGKMIKESLAERVSILEKAFGSQVSIVI